MSRPLSCSPPGGVRYRRDPAGERDVRPEHRSESHVGQGVEVTASQTVCNSYKHHEPSEYKGWLAADGRAENPSAKRGEKKHEAKVHPLEHTSPCHFNLSPPGLRADSPHRHDLTGSRERAWFTGDLAQTLFPGGGLCASVTL